jgi:hypothetical protein
MILLKAVLGLLSCGLLTSNVKSLFGVGFVSGFNSRFDGGVREIITNTLGGEVIFDASFLCRSQSCNL